MVWRCYMTIRQIIILISTIFACSALQAMQPISPTNKHPVCSTSDVFYAVDPLIALPKNDIMHIAQKAFNCATEKHIDIKSEIMTIIDMRMPSSEKRLWLVNMSTNKVLLNTFVAHGKHTGSLYAKHFSNNPNTDETSLGLYLTGNAYYGHDGYSLYLTGLEPGFNDEAKKRHIVMHGANYVSQSFIKKYHRLGRSWGCPAVPKNEIVPIVNTIKGGSLLLIFYPDKNWLSHSKFLNCSKKSFFHHLFKH